MISARTARIDDNLGRGTDGSNPPSSSGESGKIHARACGEEGLGSLLASGYSPVYPCHVRPADMRSHPIGTGPFKFVEFKPNERGTVTRSSALLAHSQRIVKERVRSGTHTQPRWH